jgi:hypothetical protein
MALAPPSVVTFRRASDPSSIRFGFRARSSPAHHRATFGAAIALASARCAKTTVWLVARSSRASLGVRKPARAFVAPKLAALSSRPDALRNDSGSVCPLIGHHR